MNNSITAGTPVVHTTKLKIYGMTCGACVRHVTRALDEITGVVHVHVDLTRNQATVGHLAHQSDQTTLIAAVEAAGYKAQVDAASDGDSGFAESTGAVRFTGCCCA